ncbi:MAG: hypothetical protein R3B90_21710 [Planctomycetaceae bacterium]
MPFQAATAVSPNVCQSTDVATAEANAIPGAATGGAERFGSGVNRNAATVAAAENSVASDPTTIDKRGDRSADCDQCSAGGDDSGRECCDGLDGLAVGSYPPDRGRDVVLRGSQPRGETASRGPLRSGM